MLFWFRDSCHWYRGATLFRVRAPRAVRHRTRALLLTLWRGTEDMSHLQNGCICIVLLRLITCKTHTCCDMSVCVFNMLFVYHLEMRFCVERVQQRLKVWSVFLMSPFFRLLRLKSQLLSILRTTKDSFREGEYTHIHILIHMYADANGLSQTTKT